MFILITVVVLKQNHAQYFRVIFSAYSYTFKYLKLFKNVNFSAT